MDIAQGGVKQSDWKDTAARSCAATARTAKHQKVLLVDPKLAKKLLVTNPTRKEMLKP